MTLPKTKTYKNETYYLFDHQYTMPNARLSAQIYANRLPKAKFIIGSGFTKDKKPIFGVYSTVKVEIKIGG